MKKNFLISAMLVLGASALLKAQQINPIPAQALVQPESIKIMFPRDPSLKGEPAFNTVSTQKALPFYTNPFATSGIYSWTRTGTGTANWTIGTTGGSLTVDNKFAASQGTYAYINSGAVGPGAYDRSITSNSINCSGHLNIALRFKQIYNKYADVTRVQISVDGGTVFTDFAIPQNDALGTNGDRGSDLNPDIQTINISSVASNQPNVKIRFTIVGNFDYSWCIDDVQLLDLPQHDLEVGDVFFTNWFTAGYSKTPKSQIDSIGFGVDTKSLGTDPEEDITIQHTITGVGTDTRSSNYVGINFLNGDRDTLYSTLTKATRWAPFNIGSYTVEMTASSANTDGDLTNNSSTNTFEVTDSVYAREYGNCNQLLFGIRKNTPAYRSTFPYIIANQYRIVKNTTAQSISFAVSQNAAQAVEGAQLRVSLKTFAAGAYTTVVTSGIYTLTASDRPTSFSNIDKFVTIGFTPTALSSNTTYFACVERIVPTPADSTKFAHILAADNNVNKNKLFNADTQIGHDFATVLFPYLAGSSTPEVLPYSMDDRQAAIRLNVAPTCALTTITATVTPSNPSCLLNNGAISVTATAGGLAPYSYSWNLPSLGTASDVSGLLPGTYTVTINDANGCAASYSDILVNSGTPSSLTIASTPSPGCGASLGELNVSGANPLSYEWSDGQVVNPATGLAAGTYMVSFTNTFGCTSTKSAIVVDANAPTLTPLSITSLTCFGENNGAINLTVGGTPFAGVATYTWNPGALISSTASISGLVAGTYTVIATDGTCTALLTNPVVVNEPSQLVGGSISKTDVSCFGGSNGALSVINITGGKTPYSYTWTGSSQTTPSINNLAAAVYSVVVKDANNCVLTPALPAETVTQPSAIACSIVTQKITSYQVTINIVGGTPPYTVAATGLSPSLIGVPAGNKLVVFSSTTGAGTTDINVTDSKGCATTLAIAPLGIKDSFAVHNLSIFPNPADNNITISFSANEAKNVSIKLLSLNGQELFNQEITQFVGEYSKTINMSNQAQGVYFLQVASDNNVITKKVVKL